MTSAAWWRKDPSGCVPRVLAPHSRTSPSAGCAKMIQEITSPKMRLVGNGSPFVDLGSAPAHPNG